MAAARWSPVQLVRQYGPIYARKAGYIAIAWVVIYFLSQPTRKEGSILMLFAPLIGAISGLVAGWYMAERSVEESSMSGLPLWVILVIGAVAPMWITDGILKLFTHWPMNFGGFMVLAAANLMALAAAVWQASSQE